MTAACCQTRLQHDMRNPSVIDDLLLLKFQLQFVVGACSSYVMWRRMPTQLKRQSQKFETRYRVSSVFKWVLLHAV